MYVILWYYSFKKNRQWRIKLKKKRIKKKIKKIEFHEVNNNNRVTFGEERREKKNKRSDVIKFNLIYIISSYFRPNQHDFTSVFRWPIFLVWVKLAIPTMEMKFNAIERFDWNFNRDQPMPSVNFNYK